MCTISLILALVVTHASIDIVKTLFSLEYFLVVLVSVKSFIGDKVTKMNVSLQLMLCGSKTGVTSMVKQYLITVIIFEIQY